MRRIYFATIIFTAILFIGFGIFPVYAQQTTAETPFVIGQEGLSGCLVCHNDKKLVNFYINANIYYKSVHREQPCTGCHIDFKTTSHGTASQNWRQVAALACIRCHQHKKHYEDYSQSIHGQLSLAGQKGAFCGDCHQGIHYQKKITEDKEAQADFYADSDQVCGQCHEEFYKSYNDYYHGQAYKQKSPDAPPCWVCHGNHAIYPSKDPRSMTNPKNVSKACKKCHQGVTDPFLKYVPLIHGRQDVKNENFIYKNLSRFILKPIGGLFSDAVESAKGFIKWFLKSSE